jgi:hypothetical protein
MASQWSISTDARRTASCTKWLTTYFRWAVSHRSTFRAI